MKSRPSSALRSKRKPVIFFAGKISDGNKLWREQLLGFDRRTFRRTSAVGTLLPPGHTVDFQTFRYGGPFWIEAIRSSGDGQAEVFRANFNEMRRSDFVFVFLDQMDAYGTLVEVGQAFVLGKTIFLGLGPNLDRAQRHELWYTCACHVTMLKGDTLKEMWRDFCGHIQISSRVQRRPKMTRAEIAWERGYYFGSDDGDLLADGIEPSPKDLSDPDFMRGYSDAIVNQRDIQWVGDM